MLGRHYTRFRGNVRPRTEENQTLKIGVGPFIYGKRQRAVVPLLCGIALMIFPYFVSNTILLVVIGAALMALPHFFRM